jgi:nucleotide-binding universal stress UspA family protein
MRDIRSILVPLTIDPETERALPHAQRLAQLMGLPIVLFTWSFDDGEAALAQHHLDEVARDLSVPATVVAHCSDERTPVPSIARAAAAQHAQIVMASHARTAVGEAVFGTVAEAVLRELHEPIVMVGPAAEPVEGPVGAIVACIDGSDLAEQALPAAMELADAIGAPLQLVEVIDPELVQALQASGRDVLETGYLATAITSIPDALRPSYEVLHGRPAAAIVDHARPGTELVAVATHGRSGLGRAVVGSVAMGVVRHARCPVLVTPPAG